VEEITSEQGWRVIVSNFFFVQVWAHLALSVLLMAIFNLSIEVALVSVVSGFLGFTLVNASMDKDSVEAFEKHCKRCNQKRQCDDFLNKNCTMGFLKHRVRMAVKLNDEANSK